jgi:peptide-methionine (S)-S-oxide reductase
MATKTIAANEIPAGKDVATLAGGCFWCLEAVYDQMTGVSSVESGYMGGRTVDPTYEDICGGDTGHAEVVRVTFDPAAIGYRDLLEVFFAIHDPTTPNRQGNDVGTQYRSAIYAADERQLRLAEQSRQAYQERLRAAGYGDITTEIAPAGELYYAEPYHQQYLAKNPNGYCGLGGTGVSCPVGLTA